MSKLIHQPADKLFKLSLDDLSVAKKFMHTYLPDLLLQSLDELAKMRGYPNFIYNHFKQWAKKRGITIHYIQPVKPAKSAFIVKKF